MANTKCGQHISALRPNTFDLRGLGTMGYGFPSGVGAQINPKATVVAVTGDGSFQMHMAELVPPRKQTAHCTLLFNNIFVVCIKQLQHFRKAATAGNSAAPDFVK